MLIGPNNCGKTSALQAIALWSIGVRTWRAESEDSAGRIGFKLFVVTGTEGVRLDLKRTRFAFPPAAHHAQYAPKKGVAP